MFPLQEHKPAFFCIIRDSERLQVLYEQWSGSNGIWKESAMYLKMTSKTRFRHRGCRSWLTKEQIALKYNSQEVAEMIIASKEALEESERAKQIRNHPCCEASCKDLTWSAVSCCVIVIVVFLLRVLMCCICNLCTCSCAEPRGSSSTWCGRRTRKVRSMTM